MMNKFGAKSQLDSGLATFFITLKGEIYTRGADTHRGERCKAVGGGEDIMTPGVSLYPDMEELFVSSLMI